MITRKSFINRLDLYLIDNNLNNSKPKDMLRLG